MFKSLIALIIVTLAVCTYAADAILDPYVPYKEHGVIEKAHCLSREPYRQKGQRTIKKGAYTTSPEPANANKGGESPRDSPNIK